MDMNTFYILLHKPKTGKDWSAVLLAGTPKLKVFDTLPEALAEATTKAKASQGYEYVVAEASYRVAAIEPEVVTTTLR